MIKKRRFFRRFSFGCGKSKNTAHTVSNGKVTKSVPIFQGEIRVVTLKKIHDDCRDVGLLFSDVDYAACFLVDAPYREITVKHRKIIFIARVCVG